MQTEVSGLLFLWTTGRSTHVFGEGTRNDTDEDDCCECAASIHVFCARWILAQVRTQPHNAHQEWVASVGASPTQKLAQNLNPKP